MNKIFTKFDMFKKSDKQKALEELKTFKFSTLIRDTEDKVEIGLNAAKNQLPSLFKLKPELFNDSNPVKVKYRNTAKLNFDVTDKGLKDTKNSVMNGFIAKSFDFLINEDGFLMSDDKCVDLIKSRYLPHQTSN